MTDLLKFIGPPGSVGFFVLGLALGLVLRLSSRRWVLARIWLLTLSGSYLLLATPTIAHGITDRLGPYSSPAGFQPDTIIVLDGDNRRGRLAAAVQTYRSRPSVSVIVLGDEWLVDRLVEAGVPSIRMQHEPALSTTLEQMRWVRTYLTPDRERAAVLIASRLQMPRVAAIGCRLNLRIGLLPSPVDIEPPRTGIHGWIPSYAALRMSRDALYEHAAVTYYSRHGWICDPLE